MPTARASFGVESLTGSPPTTSSPLSGTTAPESILISVDLPAPLSPTIATTCPTPISMSTLSTAVIIP